MSRPEISVVVPLYNKSLYIERTIRSILAQQCADFEILVVDDGSTDGGGSLVEALNDPRILLVRQNNQGRSAARNRGGREARAELVALLDADDEMGPGHLSALLRLRRLFPQAGLYATGYRKTFHRNLSLEISVRPSGQMKPVLIDNYFAYATRNIVCSSNVALPRTVLQEMCGFAQNETWGEDLDLWGRVALRYPLAYDPQVYNTYHCEACGRTPLSQPKMVFPFIRSATAALHTGSVPDHLVDSLREYLHLLWLDLCYRAIDCGARLEAMRILRDELPQSHTYAKTARLLKLLLRVAPLPTVSFLLRLLRSRYGILLERSGLHFPGLNHKLTD